ncbi:hypothetical protein [Streptomyces sp. NBC_01445]|uniref:hypothetical protein n=1 Tax=Streptomyces sp. NBC_01445 TaxID=2903869 RepID=UPI002DD86CC9|nr:hypothetical protein [Streptomyces sp. NBC_01445]WSE03612.1 hypothetical protein OG574_09670 [Streptomyces sp. NBC_01445]
MAYAWSHLNGNLKGTDINRAESIDVVGDPARAYELADTATKTVSADSGLASADKLLRLAKDL